MPRVGLIVNDGKDLAISTADLIENRLTAAGLEVARVSSSGGVVGFANPDQHLRSRGYAACVPASFNEDMALALVGAIAAQITLGRIHDRQIAALTRP